MTVRQGLTLFTAFAVAGMAVGCGSGGSSSRQGTAPVNTNNNNNNNNTPALAAAVTSLASSEARINSDVVALAMQLNASGQDVEVSSVSVGSSGTIDESAAVGALKLIGDDNRNGAFDPGEPTLAMVPAPAFVADNGSATLALAQPITIAAGARLDVLVAAEVQATGAAAVALVGQTVAFDATPATDVAASSNNQTVTPTGNPINGGPVTLALHDHLLITEIVVTPTAGEYVELFNPTGQPIDLTDVYLTDATEQSSAVWYYNLPTGADFQNPGNTFDFIVRFPAGATVASGQTVTVALDGLGFQTTFAQEADYACRNPSANSVQMLTADASNPPNWTPTAVNASAGLTNGGEPVILFTWDGVADLVQDVDYLFYGSASASNQRIDKSGVMVDGPDADTNAGAYLNDTQAFNQALVPTHAFGESLERIEFVEAGETQAAGNGVTGHDETSEPADVTFATATAPTPGAP